ncbi:MAG: hypothetical protein ACHQF3_08830 [Alphaproteobacteria bacterium]
MHFDAWTFALQTVNFAVLVWLLRRFLYRPVLQMIDRRKGEIDKQYAEANAALNAAKAKLAGAEAERDGLAGERAAALKAAAEAAVEAGRALRATAERDAAAILEGGRKTLAEERDQALKEVLGRALDLGVDIARRLADEVPSELRAETWLGRIEQHLAALPPDKRREIMGDHDAAAARVVTATALPEPVKSEWRARLQRALGGAAAVEFDVDQSLVAGADLHLPGAVLRYSWRSALAAIRSELEGHGNARR